MRMSEMGLATVPFLGRRFRTVSIVFYIRHENIQPLSILTHLYSTLISAAQTESPGKGLFGVQAAAFACLPCLPLRLRANQQGVRLRCGCRSSSSLPVTLFWATCTANLAIRIGFTGRNRRPYNGTGSGIDGRWKAICSTAMPTGRTFERAPLTNACEAQLFQEFWSRTPSIISRRLPSVGVLLARVPHVRQ